MEGRAVGGFVPNCRWQEGGETGPGDHLAQEEDQRSLLVEILLSWPLKAKTDTNLKYCSLEFLPEKDQGGYYNRELHGSFPTPDSPSHGPHENPNFSMPQLDAVIFYCLKNMATLIICPSDPNQAWLSSTSFKTCSLTGRVFSTRAWDTSLVQKMEETQMTTWPGHCKTHWLRCTWESAGGHVVCQFILWDQNPLLKNIPHRHIPSTNIQPSPTLGSY